MIQFTELYTMPIEERADILWSLELCYQEQVKRGEELEELFNKAGLTTKINSGYDRANNLAKAIYLLGGQKHDSIKEKCLVCNG